MKLRYDFHLHSCLSPCGDGDMTPFNLVNMAKILELDAIALTDHNTTGNCRSALQVGEEVGIIVLPGMELCTAEEIHVVCLFPELDAAEGFGAYVETTRPPIKNKPSVFGEQLYMDAGGNVLGQEEILLVTATSISIEDVGKLCDDYGGLCYPAHIDRSSFSILSSLGMFPEHLGFTCAEISAAGDPEAVKKQHPILEKMRVMRSSDAHYLENMTEAVDTLEAGENTPPAILNALKSITI